MEWKTAKFGKLLLKFSPSDNKFSHKKAVWQCDCGRITEKPIYSVTSGNTASCGKCNLLSAEHFQNTKYGKLRMKEPVEFYQSSHAYTIWICDCGKETKAKIQNVTRGLVASCGKCNLLSAEHFRNTKYGKLRMKEPTSILPGSHRKVTWICDCGKESSIGVYSVISGSTISCGKCNLLTADFLKDRKYGKLVIKIPKDLLSGSNKCVDWICNCGNEARLSIYSVISGKIKSCGRCRWKVSDWWHLVKNDIRSLKTPILPTDLPIGWLQLLEPVLNTGVPVKAICGSCGRQYTPLWDNIRAGRSLTCGCLANQISNDQLEIFRFLKDQGLEVKLEYLIEKWKYDICVISHKLIVEFHGLKWHSSVSVKKKELEKYKTATTAGYSYLIIYEDEWKFNRQKVENLLLNKLQILKLKPIRPTQCIIKEINRKEANQFYDQYHYIGHCNPSLTYGVYLSDQLIACMSFSHPTRQSKHEWELVRMTSDSQYRVHGIWSKLLKKFIENHHPSSIVSFSDNRLFSGSVYQKIGFKADGEIPSDYYWVLNGRRFHKSRLRKTREEILTGLTETQLREAAGYQKIWDLGKKRWIYQLN